MGTYIKKVLIIVVVVLIFIFCMGCKIHAQTFHSNNVKIDVGSYFVFKAFEIDDYLEFLENFDESKYEIVDISYGVNNGEYYMVTYKLISNDSE